MSVFVYPCVTVYVYIQVVSGLPTMPSSKSHFTGLLLNPNPTPTPSQSVPPLCEGNPKVMLIGWDSVENATVISSRISWTIDSLKPSS